MLDWLLIPINSSLECNNNNNNNIETLSDVFLHHDDDCTTGRSYDKSS